MFYVNFLQTYQTFQFSEVHFIAMLLYVLLCQSALIVASYITNPLIFQVLSGSLSAGLYITISFCMSMLSMLPYISTDAIFCIGKCVLLVRRVHIDLSEGMR